MKFSPSALTVVLAFLTALSGASAATIAGQKIVPGGRVKITYPLSTELQALAAQGGNPRIEKGEAWLVFPPGFDPSRPWPILVVVSTSDFGITSPQTIPLYRDSALAEGWVILATDASIKARLDSTQWRLGPLVGAFDVIHREWPQSARWPVAFAGFSGGSKRSAYMAPYLGVSGTARVCGLFLSGMNEDRLSESYLAYKPGASFLGVPVWLSSGTADKIATPQDHDRVAGSMTRTGFKRVRVERFEGEHAVSKSAVRNALKWFRQQGGF